MNKEKSFVFFPEHRLTPEYPFGVWLAGSYALAKGIMWLYLSNPSPGILLFPFFLLFGFGVWNFKRWAFWGLLVAFRQKKIGRIRNELKRPVNKSKKMFIHSILVVSAV